MARFLYIDSKMVFKTVFRVQRKSQRPFLGLLIALTLPFFGSLSPAISGTSSLCLEIFKTKTQIRSFRDIKSLKVMSFNVENLYTHVGFFERSSSTEFKSNSMRAPEPKPEGEIQKIREVINTVSPDIAVLIEVESLRALKHLSTELKEKYRTFLIEGNDPRGIDIGFIVKSDLPFIIEHQSHKNKMWYDSASQREIPLFSRDLPALIFRKSPNSAPFLIVLGHHAKSKKDRAGDRESLALRTAQNQGAAEIISQYKARFGENTAILLAGDFNTDVIQAPEMKALSGVVTSSFHFAQQSTPINERITHTFHSLDGTTEARQVDDIQVSTSLKKSILLAQVLRYKNSDGTIMPFARSYQERDQQPSDHLPVIIELSTDGL